MLRVKVHVVHEGSEEIDPPNQPARVDTHLNLLECKGSWMLEWPKAYIRLGDSSNPQTTPPMSRKTPASLPSPLGQSNPVAPSSAPPTAHDQELLFDTSQYLENDEANLYANLDPLDLLGMRCSPHLQPEVPPQPEVPTAERVKKSLFDDHTPENTQQDTQWNHCSVQTHFITYPRKRCTVRTQWKPR